jgi:pantetheine-phosphate adenylyltransferase
MSSVNPVTGRLLVGVTVDSMLKKKKFAEYIPPLEERCTGVKQFLNRLAPGMMNNVQVLAISDAFGPPGQPGPNNTFDALVLSHETLETGFLLNQHRMQELGLPPLKLLCTRRTESHGMSSTALRRLRNQKQRQEQSLLMD